MNDITESEELLRDIKATAALLDQSDKDVLPIPNAHGLVLVKKETPSAEERTTGGRVLYTKEIEGKNYLVCRA